jgi:hypothetical protein
MKKIIASVLVLFSSICAAQDQTTPNLITNQWTGVVNYTGTGGGYSGGYMPGYNAATNTIHFGYNQTTVGQVIAINNALSGTGIQISGYNYSWQYYNSNPYNGTLSANINLTSPTGSVLESYNYNMNGDTSGGWSTMSGTQNFNQQYGLSSVGNLNVKFTGKDARWWAGYYGPQVRDVDVRLNYSADVCASSPLSSPSCPGYAQAYHDMQCTANPLYATDCPGYTQAYQTQQCSINPLYSTVCAGYAAAYKTQQCSLNALYATDCPGYEQAYHDQQCTISALYASDCTGYAAAYKTQQCTINALYATDCPGYDQAYLNSQCIKDSLYSTKCEGYKTAYAIKYLTPLDPVVTSAVNSKLTDMVEVFKADPANVTPSTTGSSTVDSVLTTPSTTSATSTSPASPTSVLAPKDNTGGAMSGPAPAKETKQEEKPQEKKTDSKMAALEKKSGGNKEDVKKELGEKSKQLADEVGKAKSLEAQQAVQGQIVGVMNFVPGFSAYSNAMVPDINALKMAKQYEKPVVDNRSVQRQLSGASDAKWQTMVDSQYQLGK